MACFVVKPRDVMEWLAVGCCEAEACDDVQCCEAEPCSGLLWGDVKPRCDLFCGGVKWNGLL